MENQNIQPNAETSTTSNSESRKVSLVDRIKLKTAKYDKEWRRKNRKKLILLLILLLLLLISCCVGTLLIVRQQQVTSNPGDDETTSSQETSTSQESTTSSIEAPPVAPPPPAFTPLVNGPAVVYRATTSKRVALLDPQNRTNITVDLPGNDYHEVMKSPRHPWITYTTRDDGSAPYPDAFGLSAFNVITGESVTILEPNILGNDNSVMMYSISPQSGRYFVYGITVCSQKVCNNPTDATRARNGVYIYDFTTKTSTKVNNAVIQSLSFLSWEPGDDSLFYYNDAAFSKDTEVFQVRVSDASLSKLPLQYTGAYTWFQRLAGNRWVISSGNAGSNGDAQSSAVLVRTGEQNEAVEQRAVWAEVQPARIVSPDGTKFVYDLRAGGTTTYPVYNTIMYNVNTKQKTTLPVNVGDTRYEYSSGQWIDNTSMVAHRTIDPDLQAPGYTFEAILVNTSTQQVDVLPMNGDIPTGEAF